MGLGINLIYFSFVAPNSIMSNSSENKHWPDPKDFGLPYVEVKPIVTESEEKQPEIITPPVSEKSEEKKVVIEETSIPVNETPEVKEEVLVEEKQTEPELSQEKKEPVVSQQTRTPEEKKSNSWIAIVLILAVLIVSVIVWQLMGREEGSVIKESQLAQQEEPIQASEPVNPVIENTPTEEIQTPDNQDSIPKSHSSLEEPAESPQTGTTIDRTGAETLIRVESKSDRPTYYIVVGSLPNEQMAISESAQYFNRASSVYLILPYEEVKNYRLAIGSFTSFRKASEELDQIKDQYTEALWILKY